MSKPHCDLNEEWTKQELIEAVSDTLNIFYYATVQKVIGKKNLEEDDKKLLLTAPAFSYAFEFLKRVIALPAIANNNDLLLIGIQLMEKHAQINV